jgi:hypothetical protein
VLGINEDGTVLEMPPNLISPFLNRVRIVAHLREFNLRDIGLASLDRLILGETSGPEISCQPPARRIPRVALRDRIQRSANSHGDRRLAIGRGPRGCFGRFGGGAIAVPSKFTTICNSSRLVDEEVVVITREPDGRIDTEPETGVSSEEAGQAPVDLRCLGTGHRPIGRPKGMSVSRRTTGEHDPR